MKWLFYIGWFIVWFFIHSFLAVPIIFGGYGVIISSIAALMNVGIAIAGFRMISVKLKN